MALIEGFLIFSFFFLLATFLLVGTTTASYRLFRSVFSNSSRYVERLRTERASVGSAAATIYTLPVGRPDWNVMASRPRNSNLRQAH